MTSNRKWLDTLSDEELYQLYTSGLKAKKVDQTQQTENVVLTFGKIKERCAENNICFEDWLQRPQEYSCVY